MASTMSWRVVALSLGAAVLAAPAPGPSSVHIPLTRLRLERGEFHRGLGSVVPLINEGDMAYVGAVSVGTPAVTMNVVFDTGSSDFWVRGPGTGGTFNPSSSSSWVDIGITGSVTYGSGSVTASLGRDTVSVGGLAAPGVIMGVATSLQGMPSYMDGICGLAFPALSNWTVPTVFQHIVTSTGTAGSFALWLSGDPTDTSSQLTLGGYDQTKVTNGNAVDFVPLFEFTSVGQLQYWLVGLQSAQMGTAAFCIGLSCAAIVDTGTSLIEMPSAAFYQLFAIMEPLGCALQGASSSSTIVCGSVCNAAGFPSLSLGVVASAKDVLQLTIAPSQYMLQQAGACVLQFGEMGMSARAGLGDDDSSGSTNDDSGNPSALWILGDTFLRSYYTVFDVQNQQIGFTAAPLPTKTSYAWIGYTIGALALCCCCVFVSYSYYRDRRARERLVYYEDPALGGGYEAFIGDDAITVAQPVAQPGYAVPLGVPVGGTYAIMPNRG